MDEETRNKQNIWDAIGKLSLRDQIILLLAVIAVGIVLALVVFRLLLYSSLTNFHIPESTLRNNADAQTFRTTAYTDFPFTLQFPGTNFITTAGGEEHLYNNYVSSFSYSDEQLLIYGVFDDTVSISEFYSYALVSAIDTSIDVKSARYTSMVHDEGYQNTLPLMYEGGKLSASGDYYLVSYIYHSDEDSKNLLMMALTNKGTQASVNKSKDLIDRMLYSFRYDEKAAMKAEDGTKEDFNGTTPASDKYALTPEEEANMTTKEKMDAVSQKLAEDQYALEYPDATDLEYYVLVDKDIEKAVFYIDYTEARSVPQLSFLKSPGGVKYAPTYNNGDKIGLVYWEIDEPQQGNWLIHLSKNMKYGQFFAGVESRELFGQMYLGEGTPQPRDGQ